MQTVERRKPRLFSYPDHVWGPSCNDHPGCTCNVADRYSIRGYGYKHADVMLIGIAPGGQEEIWRAPLVGPSGKRNDDCLRAVKYLRERVYASNLICWRKDDPTEDETAACWPRLRAEIETVRPRLIVALGALACEWLTGYSIGKVRGNIIRPEYNRSPNFAELHYGSAVGSTDGSDDRGLRDPRPTILPTWHPAATLRVPSLATDVVRDYRKIRPFLKGRYEPLQWDWRLVTDAAEAQQVLDSLDGKRVALDVETERDLSDSFGKIVCVALGAEDPRGLRAPNGDPAYFAWVFPVEVLHGLRWPKKTQWFEHNMQFDNPAIKREYGVWLTGVHDTMLDSWARDERPGRDDDSKGDRQRSGEDKKPIGPGYHGLKQLSAEYCGSSPGYGDEMKKSFGKTLEEIAAPKLIPVVEGTSEAQTEAYEEANTIRVAQEPPGSPHGTVASISDVSEEEVNEKNRNGNADTGSVQAPGSLADTLSSSGSEVLSQLSREQQIRDPTPTKAKRKAKVPMRLETEDEAQTRYTKFLDDLYRYNAFDAINTVALPDRLPGKPCPAFETIIMPAARAYARMHLYGIPVDVERAKQLQAEWTPWIADLEKELQEEAHEMGFRNEPKLKRDLAARDAYEEVWGEGSWPLGISEADRKKLSKEERETTQKEWLDANGDDSWPGYEPLNLRSSLQLIRFLYGRLRIPVKVRSKKTRNPSVGKEAIEQMDHPFIARMDEVRTAKHIKGSHLDPIPELVKGDGRLHHNIWVNGAVNYRRSITDPPMQQYPKEHPKPFWKKLAEVRSIIRPDPGYCLIEADYKQIELWGAALLSEDPTFLADLQSGDYHTRIVREVFHCDADEKTVVFDHTRRIAKVFNFAVLYRVEENTLSKTMNEGASFGASSAAVTPREAGRLIRQWYARNRRYWQWQEEQIRQVKRHGRLFNPLGEVRRFPVYDPAFDKQIVNWPVSSTCGAHSEISAITLEPALRKHYGAQVLFDTHDSLLVHAPIKKADKIRRVMDDVMTEAKVPGWPRLAVEFKMSETSWRDMHDWK